jgi:molybdenum ABC transporter molybdate-binding protein
MAEDAAPWGTDWGVGVRLWVERAGRPVLGPGQSELLEAIDRYHSISAAARQLGLSYRHAWQMVQAANDAAGGPLVVTATGGSQGGGASLTAQGRWAVAAFRELHGRLAQAAAALLPALVQPTRTVAVHVAAASSLEEVLGQLLADRALRQPDVRVRAVFAASDELADHLLAGTPADLFLSADPRQLDRLEAAGLVLAGERVALAENSLAAIGPADRAVAVRRPADLAGGVRVALADAASPLGGYTRAYLEALGLYEAVRARSLTVDCARAVVTAVRGGLADLGLAYGSDAGRRSGCRVLFRVARPPVPIHYVAAVLDRAAGTEEARALLVFLTSRQAARRFRRCGFRPVGAAGGARSSV